MRMRIRYDFDGHIGISRHTYGTAGGEHVRIVIDKQAFKFEIVNHDGKAIVSGGSTKTGNYAVLLRQAKRALMHLGCDFSHEERDRDYGVRLKQNV